MSSRIFKAAGIIVFLILASCFNSSYKIKHKDKKLYLLRNKIVSDSVALFSDDYLAYKIIEEKLYYTDHHIVPGRVYLNLNLAKIENDKFALKKRVPIESVGLDYEIFKKIQFRNDKLRVKIKENETQKVRVIEIELDSIDLQTQ